MKRKSLLNFPLLCLNKLGLFLPQKVTLRDLMQILFINLLFIFVIAIAFVQFFYIKEDIFEIIDNLEGSAAILQIWLKFVLSICYKSKVVRIVKLSEKFWSNDKCSKLGKKRTETIFKRVSFIQKSFMFLAFFTITIVMLPFSILRNKLPLGIWKLTDEKLLFKIAWCSYTSVIFISCLFVCAFEGIFIGFSYEVILQFKILCDRLTKMDVQRINTKRKLSNHYTQLKNYIEHHIYLLRFIKELQDSYSAAFMIQYLSAAPLFCTELYAMFESPSITIAIQHSVMGLNTVVQFAFYCLPADHMAKEATEVGNAIYSSNWYSKHYLNLKKSTHLMIQQSQQQVRLTSFGGILVINSGTLLTVLKASFSICTILRNLKN